METDEILLLQRAQRGDISAFEELMFRHDRDILKLVQILLNHLQDAQDVYQETFLKAFSQIKSFRFESEFKTWLTRIAINLCMNRRRQRKIHQWFSLDNDEDVRVVKREAWLDKEMLPDEQVQRQEFWRHLHDLLFRLPASQCSAFTLKHLYGYSIKEIAKVLGCAEGTVKNHLFRAAHKLKKQVRPDYI